MKLTAFLLLVSALHVSASGGSQTITLNEKNIPLSKLFVVIQKQSGYSFIYNNHLLKGTKKISIQVKDATVEKVLSECLQGQSLAFVIEDRIITVKQAPPPAPDVVAPLPPQNLTGIITDENGKPLGGASIFIRQLKRGTQTGADGSFTLTGIPPGTYTVEISFVGFEPQVRTITVGEQAASLSVTLKQRDSQVSEVVVTALGVKRTASSLTYASQQVTGSELTQVPTDNMMNALNGKVAGLTITPSASGVGGSAKVILRGSRSANGNNQPLYVIDGIPISNSSNANGQPYNGLYGGSPDGGDGISNLNPDDIESMSVLEGASAAALYGSQAQNGVILITTKKGKAGRAVINLNSGISVDHTAYRPKFQNSYGATAPGSTFSWGPAIQSAPDNLKPFFQNGVYANNGLDLSTGSEKAQTYFSYANTEATGVEPGNKLIRNNFNLQETGHFLNDKLTVSANVNYVYQQINNSPAIGFYKNPIVSTYLFPRGQSITPYKNKYLFPDSTGFARQNWIVSGDDLYQQNPWWIADREPSVARRNRILLSGTVKYDFTPWLSAQVRGNVDRSADTYEQDNYSGTSQLFNSNGNGQMNYNNMTTEQKYGDAIVNFTLPGSSRFKLNALVGTSITDLQTSSVGVTGNLSTPDFFTIANTIASLGGTSTNTTSNATAAVGGPPSNQPYQAPIHTQLQALFANANLSWNEWLYLTLTARNDWSSNLSFTPNESFFYPSAGLSVILNKILRLPEAISFAKIRGTYAQVGNTVPPYLTNIQNTQNAAGQLSFATGSAFRTLKPERTKSIEVGGDFRFINDRITLSYTWYKTNTLNQYVSVTLPAASLIKSEYINAGNIQNTGMEVILGVDIIRSKDLTWNSSVNGSYNKNRVIDVASGVKVNEFTLSGGDKFTNELVKGGAYGDIYGNTLARNAKGQIMFTGTGAAGSLYKPAASSGAFTFLGNPNPKFQAGWNNSFTYKRFNLSFLIDGKFGGKVLSYTQSYLDFYGVSKASGDARKQGGVKVNGVSATGGAVTTVDPYTWYQALGGRNGIAGQYIYSATVVRLRQAALGYTLPITGSAVKSVRLSLTGRNLFYFSKKAPYDPELTMSTGNDLSGIEIFNQPATRNVGLNLNITF